MVKRNITAARGLCKAHFYFGALGNTGLSEKTTAALVAAHRALQEAEDAIQEDLDNYRRSRGRPTMLEELMMQLDKDAANNWR